MKLIRIKEKLILSKFYPSYLINVHCFIFISFCWTGPSFSFILLNRSIFFFIFAEKVHLFRSFLLSSCSSFSFILLNKPIFFVHTFYAVNCWTGPSISFTHSTLSTAEQVHLFHSHILGCQLLNNSIYFVHTFYAINCWTGPSISFTHSRLSTAEQVHLFRSHILCFQLLKRSVLFRLHIICFQLLNRSIFFIHSFYAFN